MENGQTLSGDTYANVQETKQQDNYQSLMTPMCIKDTPFAVINRAENEFIVVMGNYMILPDIYPSQKLAILAISKKPWLAILNAMSALIAGHEEYKQLISKSNE